jgi:hypothetical protein
MPLNIGMAVSTFSGTPKLSDRYVPSDELTNTEFRRSDWLGLGRKRSWLSSGGKSLLT